MLQFLYLILQSIEPLGVHSLRRHRDSFECGKILYLKLFTEYLILSGERPISLANVGGLLARLCTSSALKKDLLRAVNMISSLLRTPTSKTPIEFTLDHGPMKRLTVRDFTPNASLFMHRILTESRPRSATYIEILLAMFVPSLSTRVYTAKKKKKNFKMHDFSRLAQPKFQLSYSRWRKTLCVVVWSIIY